MGQSYIHLKQANLKSPDPTDKDDMHAAQGLESVWATTPSIGKGGVEPLLNDLLTLADFSKLSSLRCFNIDSSLITTLVERYRPKTHTFHLPCGECTITLEDVSLQIGMNVNGLPITRPTFFD
ncbi:hypothetical protein Lal_00008201 [Lupinus albus]|nr:hypothetical protein Lal_00008201 [Lupinus albus]